MTTQRAFNIVFGADLDPSLARAQREVRSQLEHQQRAAGRYYGQQQQAISQQLRAVTGGQRGLVQMTGAIDRASASFNELSREAQGLEAAGQDAANVRRRMAELQRTIDSNTHAIEELEQTDFGRRMVAEFRESQRAAERHREELERNGRAADNLARRQARLGNLRQRGIGVGVAAGAPLIAGAAFLGIQAQEARQTRRDQRRSGLSGAEFARQEFLLRQAGVYEPGDLIAEGQREAAIQLRDFETAGGAGGTDRGYLEALQAIGSDPAQIRRWVEEGTALINVLQRLGQVDPVAVPHLLEEIFGGTGGEQALEVDLQAFAAAAREAQDIDFDNVASARDRMLELEQAVAPLTVSMTQFAGVMAVGVTPVIDGFVAVATPVAGLVGDMNERFPVLTQILGTVGVVGLGTATVLGGFLVILPSLSAGWGIASAGARGFALSLFTVRGALITTGIGALVVGLGFALQFAADKFGLFDRAVEDFNVPDTPGLRGLPTGATPGRQTTTSAAGAPLVAPEGTIAVSPILGGFDDCPDELKQLVANTAGIERNTAAALDPAGGLPNGATGASGGPARAAGDVLTEVTGGLRRDITDFVTDPLALAQRSGRAFVSDAVGSGRFLHDFAQQELIAPLRNPVELMERQARAAEDLFHGLGGFINGQVDAAQRLGADANALLDRVAPRPVVVEGGIHVAAQYGAEDIAQGVERELRNLGDDPAHD